MNIRQRKHFLVLGLEMADFDIAAFGGGVGVAGVLPISAKPSTQEAYETLFREAFPGKNPNNPAFLKQLEAIFYSWFKVKRINPMLKDEEITGLRWMLLNREPILPETMETLLYAIAGVKPRPPVRRNEGFSLKVKEITFIQYKLGLLFPKPVYGHSGPDAASRRDLAKRKAQRLANLVFKYKIEQMEWEDGVPMEEDVTDTQGLNPDNSRNIIYYYPDTKKREEKATNNIKRKRKRLEDEAAELQRQIANVAQLAGNPPANQEVAFTVEIPVGVFGAGGGVINVMKPDPVDPASMIRASLVGALVQRVSMAQQDVSDAEGALKRVKLDDKARMKRWESFLELGKQVEEAFIDANSFKYSQIPSIEAKNYRSKIHNYDKPYIVTPQERDVYNSERGASAFVGNIDNKFTSGPYGGLGVIQ